MNAGAGGVAGGVTVQGRAVVSYPGFTLDVPIEVRAGEVLAVMGPSGAGKSTLLAALGGGVVLADGELAVGSHRIRPGHSLDVRRAGVVSLGQQALLFPHLNARENVAFGLRAHGQTRRAAADAADDWLTRVGLPGAGDRRPDELSGGQQQRVALARALAIEPRLLLLDEPLTSLDAVTAADVRAVLREQLTATATTTVVVTHDAFDAASLAQRMLVIEAGQVTQSGTVREVLDSPATAFVAAAAGLNRVRGVAAGGAWVAGPGSRARIRSSGGLPAAAVDGAPLVAVFRPADAAISRDGAGARLGWTARVTRLEPSPGGARVTLAEPDMVAEITSAEFARLDLRSGEMVTVNVDRDRVRLLPGESAPAEPAP